MDYYIDITLDSHHAHDTLRRLLTRLHEILSLDKSLQVGISFPRYGPGVFGNVLRLHGGKETLETVLYHKDLIQPDDSPYLTVQDVSRVPEEHGFVRVVRIRPEKTYAAVSKRLKKRREAGKNRFSDEEIHRRAVYRSKRDAAFPYVTMKSHTNGKKYRFSIKQVPVTVKKSGTFNTFGISSTATLPFWK